MANKDYASILITGASSGLGRALALIYAAPGVNLVLSGRDAGRLAAALEVVADQLQRCTGDAGAPLEFAQQDVVIHRVVRCR